MAPKSCSCWSKWRASNSTVFSSSRSLLFSARSRKLPAMTVAPIVMAAIRNTPPTISQRIGLPLTERGKLSEAVALAVMVWIAAKALNAGSSLMPRPAT